MLSSSDVHAFIETIRRLERRVVELEGRIENIVREGKVREVDYEKGRVKVDIDADDKQPTRWMPWQQRAGGEDGVNDWNPPQEGERVTILSPGGRPERGMAMQGGWTDDNPAPSQKGGERVITAKGNIVIRAGGTITLRGEVVAVESGGDTTIDAGGNIETTSTELNHNGKNVGDDHKHSDVKSGADNTGPPV